MYAASRHGKMAMLPFSLGLLFFIPFSLQGQHVKQIEILHSDVMTYNRQFGEGVKRLLGHVQFRHAGAVMYCDSAYYYSEENRMDAFGHIHVNQGDTLNLYGDILKYTGKDRMARVRQNVRLVNRESTLRTENLDFDLSQDVGNYFDRGVIDNGENTLKSKVGYYYSVQKMFFFKTDVQVINPRYTIYSDTLKYNTVSKIAWFFGPTNIISKEDTIYCENGWYNTDKDISQFNKNASLKSKGQILRGDSLYYEREKGFGEAFTNVSLFDSSQNILLKGNYGYYYRDPEHALLTKRAQMIKFNGDDSIFIHSDTITSSLDTLAKRVILGYHHTKVFKTDLQAKCDSISYGEADSTIHMYGDPVIWSDINQITADQINIYTRNRKVDRLEFLTAAMIVSKKDTIGYDQVKGKKMMGYFINGELGKIVVTGNGQTLYFPIDGKEVIGMNKAESSNLVIYLQHRKIDHIVFLVKPAATLYPLLSVEAADKLLKDFRWLSDYRPLNKEDIFIWKVER